MRQHKPTSKAGDEHIKPFKPNHKQKILEGLERLRIGGTFEEISLVCGLKEPQVWKRMVDLKNDGSVFDTGITRKLKSGLQGIVWQKVGMLPTSTPKTTQQQKAFHTIQQLSLL